jgi:membrane-bound lytic murein transglycosylase B
LIQLGQVDSAQVERRPRQKPPDICQSAAELLRQLGRLPGNRVGDESDDGYERDDRQQQRTSDGQTARQRTVEKVDERPKQDGDDQADEYRDGYERKCG